MTKHRRTSNAVAFLLSVILALTGLIPGLSSWAATGQEGVITYSKEDSVLLRQTYALPEAPRSVNASDLRPLLTEAVDRFCYT
jgi:hypothetical protein